jgi:hypothetical protein
LITDLSKAYELLGVRPGVSSGELKAAHRDLAKVWHPDRFVHDPRLQEKAQEKLKEINEAFDLISSGKTPRPAPPPEPVYEAPPRIVYEPTPVRPAPRSGGWKWSVVPIFLFAAVFATTTKVLLERRSHAQRAQQEIEQPESLPAEATTRTEPNTRGEATRKPNRNDESLPAENSASTEAPSSAPAPNPAVAIVTVLIDPESGLLAKPDCPVRSRMTYPSGSQPSAYCTINHAPPPKESRIKSIKEKILH